MARNWTRKGKLREATTELLDALQDEIAVFEKKLEPLKKEEALLKKKLDEEDL